MYIAVSNWMGDHASFYDEACTVIGFVTKLTFTTLLATSADEKLVIFFLFFPKNRLRPFETICMKYQKLFSGKIRKIF